MNRYLSIFLISLALALPAWGQTLNTALDSSGGSSAGALRTVIGQPFVGYSTVGGTTLQLGFIRGLFTDVDPIEGDEGLIRDTQIFRVADTPGSKIRITWDYDPNYLGRRADIWEYKGANAEFTSAPNPSLWKKVFTGAKDVKQWEPADVKVGDGVNAYYRVVQSGLQLSGIFNTKANARTVGKVDVKIQGPTTGLFKYSTISVPLIQYNDDLNSVFGQQLKSDPYQGPATELWGWGGTAFTRRAYLRPAPDGWTKLGTTDPPDFEHEYGAGYFIRAKTGQNDVNVTLVGMVNTLSFEYTASVPMRGNLYTSFSNPYPIMFGLSSIGLDSVLKAGDFSGLGDQIWAWTGDSFGARSFLKTGGTWDFVVGVPQKIEAIEIGQAYFLRRADATTGAVIWIFNPYAK